LLDAIIFNHVEVAKVLRQAGAHFGQTEERDVTYQFMQAVIANDIEKVKLFMQCGANPNLSIQDDRTPLHLVFFEIIRHAP
jgi:hypothetical protein